MNNGEQIITMEAKIRKHQDILKCSGYAVIAFGVWSIIRMFLLKILDPLGIEEMVEIQSEESREFLVAVYFIMVVVLLCVDLLFRVYVGLSAVHEGQGKTVKPVYIVLTALYAAVSVWSDLSYFFHLNTGSFSLNMLASTIIDLTSCVAMSEIVCSSLSMRRIRKTEAA